MRGGKERVVAALGWGSGGRGNGNIPMSNFAAARLVHGEAAWGVMASNQR